MVMRDIITADERVGIKVDKLYMTIINLYQNHETLILYFTLLLQIYLCLIIITN